MAGSREELAAHVKKYGASYRTNIEPGQIDSGMWELTSSPSQIYWVAGQGRLLEADEVDVNKPFMQCDIGGFIGKVDYICNNMPKTAYGCSNYVYSKPAAVIFPKSGYTVASTEDCLEIYEYFSKYRKSDDPVAVKQAIEAAKALRARCKLTDEQQTAVDQTITNTQNHLRQIQSNNSQAKYSGDNLLSGTEAVKKSNLNNLKQQYIELLQRNSQSGEKFSLTSDGQLQIIYLHTGQWYTDIFEFRWLSYSAYGGENGSSSFTRFSQTNKSGYAIVLVVFSREERELEIKLFDAIQQTIKDGGQNNTVGESNEEDINLPKIEPTTVEDYQKKVVAEAKTKGIILPPNFLTDGFTTPKKTPLARLTPTQKAAQDTINSQTLSDLIARDTQIIAEELKVNAEIERKLAEERRKIVEVETKRAEEEKRQRDSLERETRKYNESRAKEVTLRNRFKNGSVFDFPQFPGTEWIYNDNLKNFEHQKLGRIDLEVMRNNSGSFEQMIPKILDEAFKSAIESKGKWRESKVVEHHSLDGKTKAYVIKSKFKGGNIKRYYYFEGDDGSIFKLYMFGADSAEKWILKNGDALAKSFSFK